MSNDASRSTIDPTALSLPDAVRMLTRLGASHFNEERLREDINAGAPLNANGTLNVVRYAAWMLKEIRRGQ